jgi:hypothetical protein
MFQNHEYYCNKKYMIVLFYLDDKKKERSKKIFFGWKQKNVTKGLKKQKRTNLFHPYYW